MMEGAADDAIGSGDGSQQHQTTIASNITSMTGNGNEVIQTDPQTVDEFDTDSKWEITTLEKASYDCSDMYAEASPDQQNPAQAPESASDTTQSADCMDKTDDSQEMTETIVDNPTNSNSTEIEHGNRTTTEDKQVQEVIADCSIEKEVDRHTTIYASKEEANFTSLPPNTTSAEDTKQQEEEEEQQQLPKVEKNYELQHGSKDSEKLPNSDNADSSYKPDSLSPQHQQDDGTFVLSQTAVDPQMEKMIDNIVEHGGCQQFAETLQQQADDTVREKEVESIQHEISQASNSPAKVDESDRPAEANGGPPGERVADDEFDSSIKIDGSKEAQMNAATIRDNEPEEDAKEEEKHETYAATTTEEKIPEAQAVESVSQVKKEVSKRGDHSKVAVASKTDLKSVEPVRAPKNKKVEKKEDHLKDEAESDKQADDKKSLPERPVRQARLRASKRAASPEPPPKEAPEKRKKSKEPEAVQERPTKQKLIIKVPLPSRSGSARKTIATSTPSNIPEPKKVAETSFNDFECKKYRCEKCKYSTDRLNNIVHHKKSSCSFFQQHYAEHVAAQVESWKRSIQSPKSNSKRSAR